MVAVNGTETKIKSRSPMANETMKILGAFRIVLFFRTVKINVPLPTTPTMKMKAKTTGTAYASGRLDMIEVCDGYAEVQLVSFPTAAVLLFPTHAIYVTLQESSQVGKEIQLFLSKRGKFSLKVQSCSAQLQETSRRPQMISFVRHARVRIMSTRRNPLSRRRCD